MKLEFFKYHGSGNDFILVDNRKDHWEDRLDRARISGLCHRHFGIGADGLMLLSPSEKEDFRMIYFNSDGNESTMCGNGGRCLAAFAHFLGAVGEKMGFEAIDGTHRAEVQGEQVKLEMTQVKGYQNLSGDQAWMDTGSPHLILWKEEASTDEEVFRLGKSWRNHERFASTGGSNVNFVRFLDRGKIEVRTYERGVENETLSCGTGVTAGAYHYLRSQGSRGGRVDVETLGGSLSVEIQNLGQKDEKVLLIGPAKQVFKGSLRLED